MSEKVVGSERAVAFVERLCGLTRGDLARLKRNAGETIASSRNVLDVFYRLTGGLGIPRWSEEIYFLVATLYALHPSESGDSSFGETMQLVRRRSSTSVDERFKRLLECEVVSPDNDELAFKLRQAVGLAKAKQVAVSWPLLIDDLCGWGHENRWVQRKWARQYYGQLGLESEEDMKEGERKC